MLAVTVGNTLPNLWVGVVLGALILIGQRRTRLWSTDKISTRPAALTAFGLLVYFGYTGTSGNLDTTQLFVFLISVVIGCTLGVLRAWTLRMWLEPTGIRVQGSPGTLLLWLISIVGACVAYGITHVGYGCLVLFLGACFLSQQFATIFRGVRARPHLVLAATPPPTTTESPFGVGLAGKERVQAGDRSPVGS